MNPLVSVIIPVYNNAPYLCQCLDSVVNQTLKDIEIICVDDGSTDNSLMILTKYAAADSRINVYQQKNKGGGAARNLGLSHASGKYLAFIDSDDYYDYDALNAAYVSAESKNADIVFFGYNLYNTKSGKTAKFKSLINHPALPRVSPFSVRDCPDEFIDVLDVLVWNKLFNKSFINNLNLKFMEIHNSNDVYFSLVACYSARNIVSLNDSYYYFRRGHGTNIQSRKNKSPFDNYHAYLAIKEYLLKLDGWNLIKRGFNNKTLSECVKYLNQYYVKYPSQYQDLLSMYVEEGFSKLGLTDYPKKQILNKWVYLQYREYLKEYDTGVHRQDGVLFKLMKYIYNFLYYTKYMLRQCFRFGAGVTVKSIVCLLSDIFSGVRK